MSDSGDITAERVKSIDAFSELSDDALAEVASLARERNYREGDELLHHGEWPDDLLAVEEGTVEVRKGDEVLAELGAGTVVGERGVLERALRNADVVAASPVRALYFHRNKIQRLKRDMPELAEKLQELASEREK